MGTQSQRSQGTVDQPRSTVLTIPNALSFLRLAAIPLVVWLLVGPHADLIALGILAASAVSDWADGVLARKLGQVSRLGQLLDPLADRLYTLAILAALVVRDIAPWWLAAAVVVRDIVLGFTLLILRRHGYGPLQVNYIGKTGTLCLFAAFPALLLAQANVDIGVLDVSSYLEALLHPIGWALVLWGLALYWLAGSLYIWQTVTLVKRAHGRLPAAAR